MILALVHTSAHLVHTWCTPLVHTSALVCLSSDVLADSLVAI